MTNVAGSLDLTLTDGHIYIGNGSNIAADVAVSGDVTITNAGVTAIKNNVALGGNPTTTTQSAGDNSTKIATTAFVTTAVAVATVGSFGLTVDGAGSVITTGSKGYITIPFNCTVNNWYMAADTSGSMVIDVKRSGSSIVGGGNKPTLSSQSSANAAVSGWTSTSITAGDIIEFNVDSASTITRVNLVLKITKT